MDDVAEIDADAEQHPPFGGNSKLRSAMIFWMATAHNRAYGARELRHDAVAGDIDNSSAVLGDERQNDRLVRFEFAHRLFFVAPMRRE